MSLLDYDFKTALNIFVTFSHSIESLVAGAGVMYSAFIKASSRTQSEDIAAVSAAAPGERCHSEQTGQVANYVEL